MLIAGWMDHPIVEHVRTRLRYYVRHQCIPPAPSQFDGVM